MKKLIALSLIMIIAFSIVACRSDKPTQTSGVETVGSIVSVETVMPNLPAETETVETTAPTEPEETYPASGVYGGNIVLGNITFIIPEGFTATVVNDTTFVLSSQNDDCAIGLAAIDVSNLDEEKTKTYLPLQHDSFVEYGDVTVPADDVIAEIAGIPVTLNACGTTEGAKMILCIDGSFTDSWYAYTIVYKCDLESESKSEYNNIFVDLLVDSEHNGREARFDFVQ